MNVFLLDAFSNQRDFLIKMGGEIRASELIRQNSQDKDEIISGWQRLIDPKGMGFAYKILEIQHPDHF